jgi:hypothetical protein
MRVKKLLLARNVIPGRPEGPSPEPKHTCISYMSAVRVDRFRVRGLRPRPGMTAFWYLFARSCAGMTMGEFARNDDWRLGSIRSEKGLALGGDEQEGGAPVLVGEARLRPDLVGGGAPFLDMG